MNEIRRCRPDERAAIVHIINAGAQAYRGVIPADCWHEPYMSQSHLEDEIADGVEFWGYQLVGGALIAHLRGLSERPMLVGTWAAATWAIAFYQRHGFELVPTARTAEVLTSYWNISERQIETSVVLANPLWR